MKSEAGGSMEGRGRRQVVATHEFRPKTVVVTGASSGIGRATAIAFGKRGANVVLAARREQALEEVRQAVQALGAHTLVVPTDVSDPAQVKNLVDASLVRFGSIDVFVANAGMYLRCACQDLTAEDVEQVMAVNFLGSVRCLLEVLPHMLQRGAGHLVVVSSVDGKKGIPPDGAYVASKFALTGFADVLRQELRGTGVHVSTILPGRIDTPMIADIEVPSVSAKVPPERVAEAIVRAVVKRKAEVLVPLAGSKTLLLVNTVSPRAGDWLVRHLHLEGVECRSGQQAPRGTWH
jgi:short-subunit dehydrogenase